MLTRTWLDRTSRSTRSEPSNPIRGGVGHHGQGRPEQVGAAVGVAQRGEPRRGLDGYLA
jgi:hypothetical protein